MASGERYVEWFDLRMLCTGRAREALERGDATLRVRYGFRSRSRRRWVARQENERRPPFRVETELSWSPPAANDASEADAESPVRVSLADQTSRGTPRFAARVRGSGRAYLRDDQWSFVISGPLGDAVCQVSRARIVPIVDFFSRLTRRGRRTTLDAGLYCPDESFSVAGVYEVTPRLELVHDGAQYELSAHTGTYTGEPAVFRVRRRSYVEQRVEDLFATPNERGDDDE